MGKRARASGGKPGKDGDWTNRQARRRVKPAPQAAGPGLAGAEAGPGGRAAGRRGAAAKAAASKYKHGVRFSLASGSWTAFIEARGRYMFLGAFAQEVDAARAHDVAALHLLGRHATINLPTAEYYDRDEALKISDKMLAALRVYERVAATSAAVAAQRVVASRLPCVWKAPAGLTAALACAKGSRSSPAPAPAPALAPCSSMGRGVERSGGSSSSSSSCCWSRHTPPPSASAAVVSWGLKSSSASLQGATSGTSSRACGVLEAYSAMPSSPRLPPPSPLGELESMSSEQSDNMFARIVQSEFLDPQSPLQAGCQGEPQPCTAAYMHTDHLSTFLGSLPVANVQDGWGKTEGAAGHLRLSKVQLLVPCDDLDCLQPDMGLTSLESCHHFAWGPLN